MANPRMKFNQTPFRRASAWDAQHNLRGMGNQDARHYSGTYPDQSLRGVGDAWEYDMTNVNDSSSAYGGDVVIDNDGNTYQLDENGNILAYTSIDGTITENRTVPPDLSSPPVPEGKNANDWAEVLSKAIPQVLTAYNAYQMSQINVDRARRGLPALQASQYGPRVGVGLAPDTQKLVMYGALAIGAVFLLSKAR